MIDIPADFHLTGFDLIGASGDRIFLNQNGSEYSHEHALNSLGETVLDFMLANYLQSTVSIVNGIRLAGRIYAVLVYDAYLTEAELQAHYLVDKARFGTV